ncbi:flagellar basal body P-ring protein FlgI [Natronospirillum operosum]|uniref:Flagellar P-ring protein n=1 Tax=Natronospirillum operosum TaxID=2759953 RepID=A0A4Z0WK46_9GAMM|nr:flagellar basal body P-ring protein FlgI [Natronospirillum operosum]TGG95993.1 flagellar basal body P-ring protein FlgI [Natronospirillum operosum]
MTVHSTAFVSRAWLTRLLVGGCLLLLTLSALAQQTQRIKDLASVAGVRENQLIGYGLVVGLDGSGDRAPFTNQTFSNMMGQFGISIPEGTDPRLRNVAAVSVHASLPAFARPGQTIDVTVSSLGNAGSLRGGSLLMTPLTGPDGNTYAVAQGNLLVGGFGVEGADGSSVTVNVPSAGRIPNGAIVEREVATGFNNSDYLTFNLNRPDFTTATRMADSINDLLGPETAYALDGGSVRVTAPRDSSQRVSYMSVLENLQVEAGEERARVIVNARTGTIVVGKHVTLNEVAVTHGNLTVTIDNTLQVAQPAPFTDADPVVVPDTDIDVEEDDNRMFLVGETVTLEDLVNAVNGIGAAPGDLMAILEAMQQAGALNAELIVI